MKHCIDDVWFLQIGICYKYRENSINNHQKTSPISRKNLRKSMKSMYAVPITEPQPGESSTYRSPLTAQAGLISTLNDFKTLQDLLQYSKQNYGKSNYLGTKQPNNQYSWLTYNETFEMSSAFGSGLMSLKLIPLIKEYKDIECRFLGIYSRNRAEYIVADWAGILYGLTHVPIYDTLGPQAMDYIFKQTKMEVVLCSKENVLKLLKQEDLASVRTVISFDEINEEAVLKQMKEKKLNFFTFQQIVQKGRENPLPFVPCDPRTLYVVSYTSGTTGNPKGAMLTHSNFMAVAAVGKSSLQWKKGQIYLSFLPMAHAFERLAVTMLTYFGCAIGYYGGDPAKLKEDFQVLKPHIVAMVPRIFNRFYDVFQANIQGLRGLKKWLITKAVAQKLKNLTESNKTGHFTYDRVVFKKIREALGGRLKSIVIGSAPTAKEVMEFMRIALNVTIIEGYGQTESTGASFLTSWIDNQSSGCVGGPTSMCEFKLVDIPEMNYSAKDVDEKGVAIPRGEMCIRGPGNMLGYYKDEEKTKEAIDEQGWLHTGDVCLIQPNGSIKVIDRKKNIFKLSQGEYIAPEKLEGVYKNCGSVAEIFVWGDSLQSYLVAVVVPEAAALRKFAQELGIKYENEEELLEKKEIKKVILEEMKNAGKKKGFTTFELIRNIILERNPFVTKDLLTTTFKMKRNEARKCYQGEIEKMYSEGMII